MASKKKTTTQKLADDAAADAMLRRPMEPTPTLVQPQTIEELASATGDVGGEVDPLDAQLAEENRVSAACYDALFDETSAAARPLMPTTTDPASSPLQAQATQATKATTAHGFALVTAYGIALATRRDPIDALREVLSAFPEGMRRRAIEIARKKELPGGGCDTALKALASEQMVNTSGNSGGSSKGTAGAGIVTVQKNCYVGVLLRDLVKAKSLTVGDSFTVHRSHVAGKLTITLVQQ